MQAGIPLKYPQIKFPQTQALILFDQAKNATPKHMCGPKPPTSHMVGYSPSLAPASFVCLLHTK